MPVIPDLVTRRQRVFRTHSDNKRDYFRSQRKRYNQSKHENQEPVSNPILVRDKWQEPVATALIHVLTLLATVVHDYAEEGPTLEHGCGQEEKVGALVTLTDTLTDEPRMLVLAGDTPTALLTVNGMGAADY